MDQNYDSYADVLESYLVPATEGIVSKIATGAAIIIGLPFLATTALIGTAVDSKTKKRLANPTPGEKESLKNYQTTWLPAIKEFQKGIAQNLKKFPKVKKAFEICALGDSLGRYGYKSGNTRVVPLHILTLDWEAVGEHKEYSKGEFVATDDYNPEMAAALSGTLKTPEFKSFLNTLKTSAKKFEPYFKLKISVDDREDTPDLVIVLECTHCDRLSILKPGLPPFKG